MKKTKKKDTKPEPQASDPIVDDKALVPTEASELAIMSYDEIPDETIDTVISAGHDSVTWLKNTPAGFLTGDRVLRTVDGRIVFLRPHLIFWKDSTPTKIDDQGDGQPVPEGFERRCDVHLLTNDNFLLGISIPQSSYKRNFSGYIQSLRNQNMKPDHVITRFSCREKKNKDRSFPSIEASFVGPATLVNEPEGDVPF